MRGDREDRGEIERIERGKRGVRERIVGAMEYCMPSPDEKMRAGIISISTPNILANLVEKLDWKLEEGKLAEAVSSSCPPLLIGPRDIKKVAAVRYRGCE